MADGEGSICGTALLCGCLLIVVIGFFAVFSGGDSSNSTNIVVNKNITEYDMFNGPPGDWNVINGSLTNGTFNTTDLTRRWDRTNRIFHVDSPEFTFVYKDANTTRYRGDSGLEYSMFYDTVSGCCYHIEKDLTRGIAYATGGSFDIDGFNFSRSRISPVDYYFVYSEYPGETNVTLDKGTVIMPLSIGDNLTFEEKKYFDDYDEQLYKYYEEKKIKELKDNEYWTAKMENEMEIQNRIAENKKSSGHFRGYTGSGGYVYGRYY